MTDEYIARLKERIFELEQRGCQFDCRAKRKDDFIAGYMSVDKYIIDGPFEEDAEQAFEEWRKGDE